MQFFRARKNNNEKNNNNNNQSSAQSNHSDEKKATNTMEENDILDSLDQLATSENSQSAEFSDDPQGPMDGTGANRNGLARVLGGSSATSSSGGHGSSGGGIESLNMLDSDDIVDSVFADNDDDPYGGGDDFGERSPNSYGHNSNNDLAGSLSEDFKALLTTPLTAPILGQPKAMRVSDSEPTEDLPTSDDEHDEEHDGEEGEEHGSDDDKSSESGEDYTDDEDEGESGYKPGGYHPVQVGDVFNQK